MKEKIFFLLVIVSLLGENTVSAIPPPVVPIIVKLIRDGDGGDNPGGIPGGAIVGIASGGTALSGASALAFAPLLLAGLEPNSVVFAAAPLECISCTQNYLQCAIINHFECKDYNCAMGKIKKNSKYFAQNNSEIINGTYDMFDLTIPEIFRSSKYLKVNITLASQPYKEIDGKPELALGIFKNIQKADLRKKFETQQFLHHYLMKKYETSIKITQNKYNVGIQKLSGIIDMSKVQNKQMPIQIVLRYTENGFRKGQKMQNPKTLIYAYIVEFEKIR